MTMTPPDSREPQALRDRAMRPPTRAITPPAVTSQIPRSRSSLAPDATALGQVYYYVLEPPSDMDLAELRSKQDFFIKYALQSVEGVAEVASIGGYVKQYQIEVDPDLALHATVHTPWGGTHPSPTV